MNNIKIASAKSAENTGFLALCRSFGRTVMLPAFAIGAVMLGSCGPQRDSGSSSSAAPQDAKPPLAGARIGAPFALTNQDGKTVRDTDFSGQYRLIYFGYSYCPDVCPVDLARLMAGLKQFENKDPARAAKVQPIFVTLDPERDTPAALKTFAANFHPRLIALTGTPAQIKAAADGYLVRYEKTPGSDPSRYLIAHTQLAYLMDGAGKPVALLPIDDSTTPATEGEPAAVAAELDRWVR